MDCESNFNDPWCFCFNAKNESIPQYKQFDANYSSDSRGIGFHCCHITHYDPSFIAQKNPTQGTFNSATNYLKELNNQATNDVCDYSEYLDQVSGDVEFKNKFPDLYDTANTDLILFNAFYNHENTIHQGAIADNTELLPTISATNVSCPKANYIPYYIGYENNEFSSTRYIYVCYPEKAAFPNLDITYKSIYFYDNNGNDCKKSDCTTKFGLANAGVNAGNTAHENDKNDALRVTSIVLIAIAVVLIFVAIVVIIYFSLKEKKKLKGKN
jgi:ABC-type antimicrobial peptide transport system permease subunit